MANEIDFDALARKANESGGAIEDLNRLFGAAFALEKWHFISRGELPQVNPYIASNAAIAGGQQMVRAFTDTGRLQRFARENNLIDAAGNILTLDIPTSGIVEYLEQFIPYGVGGIWFNSDSESDGFFLPLQQLRAVKTHLEKLNQTQKTTKKPNLETTIIIVKDGLLLPSGFISQATYTCNLFCRVPPDWLENGKIKSEFLEKIYKKVYGDNWRTGNSDGSRYVVLDSYSEVFPPETVKNAQWSGTENTKENQYWFYIANENNEIKSVTAEDFQADINAAFQS